MDLTRNPGMPFSFEDGDFSEFMDFTDVLFSSLMNAPQPFAFPNPREIGGCPSGFLSQSTILYLYEWCMREMKASLGDLVVRGVKQPMVPDLPADETEFITYSERLVQGNEDRFDKVCKRKRLKVNAGRGKITVFDRAREQNIEFAKPYSYGREEENT